LTRYADRSLPRPSDDARPPRCLGGRPRSDGDEARRSRPRALLPMAARLASSSRANRAGA
jgi:hypothetical protein